MRVFRVLALFFALLIFWFALSWRFDPLFVVIGVVSAAATTAFSLQLVHHAVGPADEAAKVNLWYLAIYLVWLLSRIPPAGLQIAVIVLHPRKQPRPGVFVFRSRLSSPAAKTMLANSITLVPGTLDVSVDDDMFTVHAFEPQAAADIASAETQRRIARAFGDPLDDPPRLYWEPIHDQAPEEKVI